MSYLIEFKFGLDWQSYPVTLNDFTITEVLHNNLKPADSSCAFSLIPDLSLYNLLRGIDTQNIPVRIKKNDLIVFYGYIRKTFEFKKTQRLHPVKIELVSPSFILKKKITTDHRYVDTSLNTIVEALLQAGGITNYNLPNFNITVPVFLAPEDATYHDVLATLLLEYGYLFYFDKEGVFRVHRIYPESLSTTKQFNGSNCIDQISQTKKEEQKEKVVVKFYELKTLTNTIVFSDTTNARDGYKCYIELAPQQYLGDKEEWFAEFNHEEGEILYVSGINLDIRKGQYIQVLKFEQHDNRALLSLKNTSTLYDDRILKLDITASTIKVKKSINTAIVQRAANPNNTEEIEAKYIFSKTYADALANYLSWYYKYCDFTYKLKSKTNYALGDIVNISEYGIGSITARIIKRTLKLQSGVIEYELEGVSEYTPATADGSTYIANPIPQQTINNIYDQIDNINNTLSGEQRDQTVPLNPVAVEAKAYIDGIYLRITPAGSGTLLEQAAKYQIQRSTDQGSTWYDVNGILDGTAAIANTQYFWQFNRSTDGYPEASGIPQPWAPISYYRFRIKAVNSVGTEAPSWFYVSSVDTSDYGTWLPSQPTGGGGLSAMREVRAMVDEPSGVFGIIGYDIQISKDQTNWYKPALGLDVYASEENWKIGNEGEWRRISIPQWTQSVPLEQQNTDPQPTTYYFRFRVVTDRPYISGTPAEYVNSNGKTAGAWSANIPVVATPTSAYDVIKARKADGTMQDGALGADKIYAQNLAAIVGNLAALSGGQDDPYNYWALSDYPDRPSDRPVGKFRAGTQNVYLVSNPVATGTEADPYIALVSYNDYIKLISSGILIKASTIKLNSLATRLKAGKFEISDEGDLDTGLTNPIEIKTEGSGSNKTGIIEQLNQLLFRLNGVEQFRIKSGRKIALGDIDIFRIADDGTANVIHNKINETTYGSEYNITTYNADVPRMTMLQDGRLLCVYRRISDNYLLCKIRETDGTWGSESVVVNTATSLAGITTLQDGRVLLVYTRTDNQTTYEVIRNTNGTWGTPVSISLGQGEPSLCVLTDGSVLSVYRRYISGAWKLCQRIRSTNGTWGSETVINNSDCRYPNAVRLPDNTVVCIYFKTSDNDIYQMVRDPNGYWSAESLVASLTYPPYPVAVLAPDNRVVLYYQLDTSSYTYLAQRIRDSNGNWSGEYVLTTAQRQYAGAGVTSDGKIILVYQRSDGSNWYLSAREVQYSQTSYYQLGAGIIEVGSNSNGTWIKFSDGTMIVYKNWSDADFGSIITGSDGNYKYKSRACSFPAQFSETPTVQVSGDNNAAYGETRAVYSVTNSNYTIESGSYNNSSFAVGYFSVFAIGRWK